MRASDLAPTEHDMGNDTAEIKRWTAKRRTALVLEIIRGETTAKEAARQHDLKVSDIQHWHDTFLGAGENGLKSKPKEEMELKNRQIRKLKEKIGDLVMKQEIFEELQRRWDADHPFGFGNNSKE